MIKGLIISCRTTCGCGNKLVPYTKQTETTDYLLTCKPFSDKFDHPLLIAISKNSPVFIESKKLANLLRIHGFDNTFDLNKYIQDLKEKLEMWKRSYHVCEQEHVWLANDRIKLKDRLEDYEKEYTVSEIEAYRQEIRDNKHILENIEELIDDPNLIRWEDEEKIVKIRELLRGRNNEVSK